MKLLKKMLEVAPPGREKQVKKLKRKVGPDAAFAIAWAQKNKEAMGYGGLSQLLRPGAKKKKSEIESLMCADDESKYKKNESFVDTHSFNLIESMAAPAIIVGAVQEGPRVKCVLITEGLGNRADMNYYSAEAIHSGAPLFEGVPCYLDHMGESESNDRPERSVKDKCGYFKNVHVEKVDGKVGLVAELHFDLSETGKLGYEKALTAIHYKKEMPLSEREYVGLSITADGDRVPRSMEVEGEILDVKYVTAFTRVGSVDEVTVPARGGRFLAALVESAAGAMMKRKETRMKLIESAKAAQSALKEALKDKDMAEASKSKLVETDSFLSKLLEEAMKAADKSQAESEESASEEAEALEESKKKEAKKKESKKKMESDSEEADDANDDEKDDSDEKDSKESHRIAIASLLKESGIPKKMWGLDGLVKLKFSEAKEKIEEKKSLIESIREDLTETPVGFGAPLRESDGGEKTLNSLFVQ